MNKKIMGLVLVLNGMVVTVGHSAISCSADENKVTYFVGFDTHATDVPAIAGFAPGGEGDATLLLNNFVSHDYNNTSSEVLGVTIDLADGSISSDNITGEMELLSTSDLSTGKADFSFCVPGTLAPGGILSHAVYYDGNSFVGVQSNTGTVRNGVGVSVINASSSDNVGKTFNNTDSEGIKGVDRMIRLVEENTLIENSGLSVADVADAKKKLTQRIFTTALNYTTDQTNKDNVQFKNPFNAFVEGNTIYVEGIGSRVDITSAVTGVKTISGSNVLSNGRLSSLENKTGQTYRQKTLEGNKPVHILEARGDLSASSAYTCDEGSNVTIAASFARSSHLEGIIKLYNGNTLLNTATDGSLQNVMACDDLTLRLESYRVSTRGVGLKPQIVVVSVSKNVVVQTRLLGLDTDLDGNINVPDADLDGNLDGVININCNAPVIYVFDLIADPAGQHTYFGGSMPQGMSLNQGSGRISYDAPCSDAGQTFVPGFNADNGPTLDIQFKVQ